MKNPLGENDSELKSNPHLGGGEADAVLCVHDTNHIGHKILKGVIKNCDGLCFVPEDRVRKDPEVKIIHGYFFTLF